MHPRKRKTSSPGGPKQTDLIADKLQDAKHALGLGEHSRAIALCRQILRDDPKNLLSLVILARSLHASGRIEDAIESMRKAVEAHPKHSASWTELGNYWNAYEQTDEAESCFRRAIELDPISSIARYNLARTLSRTRRFAEAIKQWKDILSHNPLEIDARQQLVNAFREENQLDNAITVAEELLEMQPASSDFHQLHCHLLRQANRREEFHKAVANWLEVEPNHPVASHMLASLNAATRTTEGNQPDRCSKEYVRAVFDRFAQSFDQSLSELDNRIPELIGQAVERYWTTAATSLSSKRVILDAGCGTGLCGIVLVGEGRIIDGVDLSSAMLEKARERQIYSQLVCSDLYDFLERPDSAGRYDLIVAGDTFNYFGDLTKLFCSCRAATNHHGCLLFTLESETTDPSITYQLKETGRFVHSQHYVLQSLQDSGYSTIHIEEHVLRKQANMDVLGILIFAR